MTMKTIILTTFFIFQSLVFAQSTHITNQSGEGYTQSAALTQEQQEEANNYVNYDHIQQLVDEECGDLKDGLTSNRKRLRDGNGDRITDENGKKIRGKDSLDNDFITNRFRQDDGFSDKKNAKRQGRLDGFDPCSADGQDELASIFGSKGDKYLEIAIKAYTFIAGGSTLAKMSMASNMVSGMTGNGGQSSGGGMGSMMGMGAMMMGNKDKKEGGFSTIKVTSYDKNENGDYLDKDKNVVKSKEEANKTDEHKQDYCVLIPAATEIISIFTLGMKASNQVATTPKPGDEQMEAFFDISTMHKDRKNMATAQGSSWAAAAACYIPYVAKSAVAGGVDTKTIIKMAGSGAISAYYFYKAKKHRRASDYFNRMGEKFRGLQGQCNPITEKKCFCAFDKNESSPHCLPVEWAKTGGQTTQVVTCVDNMLQNDPDCNCMQSNSCFDVKTQEIVANMGANAGLFGSMMTDMGGFFNGTQSGASLTNGENQLGAVNRWIKTKGKKLVKPNKKLAMSSKQKRDLKAYMGLGLPPGIAQIFAKTPMPKNAGEIAKKLTSASSKNLVAGVRKDTKRASAYKGSRSSAKRRSKSGSSYNNPFAKFNKRGAKKSTSQDVLRFAEKAHNQAQIERNTGKPIFDIISHRYRNSAWRRFDLKNQ